MIDSGQKMFGFVCHWCLCRPCELKMRSKYRICHNGEKSVTVL